MTAAEGAAAVAVGLAAYAALVEPQWIHLRRYTIAIPHLGPAFDGFCILHLSDLHGRVGVFHSRPYRLALSEADAVVVTGDLYASLGPRAPVARALAAVSAPVGVWMVSGNHDYRRGRLHLAPLSPGPRLLDNRVVGVRRGDDQLWLLGLPDPVKGRPEWSLLAQPRGGVRILLVHRPDAVEQAARHGIEVVLAGHTHGGQVVVPGWGAPIRHTRLPGRYAGGVWVHPRGTVLITSRGLGTSELPIRFACPPEVVLVTLRRGNAAVHA